ncbi:AfsR/SARP family transcriptional regulator [Armatimonas rosea]|uniref:Putative ATPase/DNA-binding SARP family transcriptional activator n=1 Tax=Armatimonas rosea TaxID=685828 RepID=A0A7W9SM04_ARMRO|nr:tetratricopeptide repeat protein [Armatimonas rosea]MBB6048639.1 putative ATPase/DNA-binding SARP family transcriptional activator [Armatimonas rosea]
MLYLRLFGPITVEVNGEPLPSLRSRRGLYLLALLTLRANRELSRVWLAGVLWPESDDSQGLENLKRSLTDLRKALGPAAEQLLSPTKHTLVLRLASEQADVLTFDQALRKDTTESLEQAISLYRAPLLEGYYEVWATEEREPRHEAYFRAVEQLALRKREQGKLAEALPFLRQAVVRDYLREGLQRLLMEALAASGNPLAATEVYRELRSTLRRESNSNPSTETTALYNRIRALASAPAPPAPPTPPPAPAPPVLRRVPLRYNLPRPLTALIGREREQAAITECLSNACLVTLTGTGGIGKTRLALETAWEQQKAQPDGACFVDLAPLRDPNHLPHLCAAALGLKEIDKQPIIEALVEHLRPRALLLVLDNCEHMIDASAELAGLLLQSCPNLQILTTSRQPLGITGEVVWRVPVLETPTHSARPEELTELIERYAALKLFFERAQAVQPDLVLTPETVEAAIEICQRLDGIPLALELAAARARTLSIEQIARRLDDRFKLLTGGSRIALPRQQTLRALNDWSYDLLTPPERCLLTRLSIFHASYSLEAVEAICADGAGLEQGDVLDLLELLVNHSLVLTEESEEGQRRYRMLETIREYSRLMLPETDWPPLSERYQAWYQQLAHAAETNLLGSEQAHWLACLDAEYHNLRHAIVLSVGEQHLELCTNMCRYWYLRGHWTEGRAQLLEALARPDSPQGTPARAQALMWAGNLARNQGDYAAATHCFEESLALRRALHDGRGSASILNHLASVLLEQGYYERAQALYEESLALCRELGETKGIARALHNLGLLANEQGDNERAMTLYTESLALSRSLGDRYLEANDLQNLGDVAVDQGDYQRARSLMEQALAIHRELGMEAGIVSLLMDIGKIELVLGGYEAAQTLLEESLELNQSLGDQRGIAQSLNSLGLVALARGELATAHTLLLQSLPLGQRRPLLTCLIALAHLARREDKLARAAQLLGAADRLRENMKGAYTLLEKQLYDDDREQLCESLGMASFSAEYGAGYALTEEAAQLLAGQ